MLTRADSDADRQARERARAISKAGGLEPALAKGLPKLVECTLSEALVLGLLRQGVRKYFAIFGHGSTDLGNVLRIYEEEEATRTVNCRNEVEMAHAATALRWQYGELSAVVTSIGPGAMQAFAGSLAAASNGVGVYHIYGDETTFGEGYNMQQVPKEEQGLFGRMTAIMGQSYVLHTPEGLRDALRRGALCVNHPYRAGPFYLLLPLNTQPAKLTVNLAALPERPELSKLAPADDTAIEQAAEMIAKATKVAIKAGGGTRGHDAAVRRLAVAAGAAVVLSPGSTGVLPDAHPQNMHVGGSKGSISGNHAMAEAELLIVIGSRAVCQADCSGIGYKNAKAVININGDLADALHYNRTLALIGDISAVADRLTTTLEKSRAVANKNAWLKTCAEKKSEWIAYKRQRFECPPLRDDAWQKPVLPQPAAIKIVADFAKQIGAAKFFDAGDV
ncbi:MAG: thiamine pyrophosphate-binding protein, partial [Pseudolabrys sp.]